jgi:hypothetical protein
MGPRDNWFRRTSWTDADQQDFERHLARARPLKRPQYLRIQSVHLVQTGDPALIQVAQSLIERFLRENGDDVEIAFVHELSGQGHEALDEVLPALNCYRQAMAAERRRRNVQSNAWLRFGWLVIRRKLTSLYLEADSVLEEFAKLMPFPYERYRYHSIRAIVAAHRGYVSKAKEEAGLALAAAAATHSGFRYHPTLGLVNDAGEEMRGLLEILAAG